jgi:uncharacterized protein (TIGR02599 family)
MKTQRHSGGFTLVEVLVSAGIVVVLMIVLLGMTDQTQRLVKATSSKVEQFQEARVAFEAMTRRLSQATLNSFWDYQYDQNGNPNGYTRKSELRFHSGPMRTLNSAGGPLNSPQPGHGVFFQAPLGMVSDTANLGAMDHLMNTWGYFLEIGSDADKFPTFLSNVVNPRKRYRLMELMEPAEKLSVYKNQNDINNRLWFSQSISSNSTTSPRPVRVLAENVVALIILPRLSLADEKRINSDPTKPPVLAPGYNYDSTLTPPASQNPSSPPTLTQTLLNSKNQLPPVVQVIMVAIDEPSARRLEDLYGPNGTNDPYLGIGTNPDPLYKESLFTDPSKLNDSSTGTAGDLTKLTLMLSSSKTPNIRASYRVFSSNVNIKGAKWSLHTSN